MSNPTLLGIAASLVLATSSSAAIINVPGDFGTIQAAIADPGTVAGDEIVVAPGNCVEAIDFILRLHGEAEWVDKAGVVTCDE